VLDIAASHEARWRGNRRKGSVSVCVVILVIGGLLLLVAITFIGFQWVQPKYLRIKAKWNCLEVESKKRVNPVARRCR
jgi:hypothetical protein